MTDLPRKILLATDGSPESDPELRAAADLSARTGAPVRVVHVGQDMPPARHANDPNWGDLATGRKVLELVKKQAEAIEARGGIVAEVYATPNEVYGMRNQRPGQETVKNTREEDVGLVVVGDHGMGPFRYATRTSIPAIVVRDAWCPVLVVRGGLLGLDQAGFDQKRFPRKILLATDGSPDVARAAQEAVEISKSGSELHVAYIEDHDSNEERGQAILDGEVRRIEGYGVTVTATHLLSGDPAAKIQELAEEIGAELVVVGGRVSGPEGGPRAAASTSRSIVDGSSLPVLVVRGDQPARPLVQDMSAPEGQEE